MEPAAGALTSPLRAASLGIVACGVCGSVQPADATACTRCGAPLRRRKRDSLARTWALLVAALIFYVPANVLPVMYTKVLGPGGESTILEGIVEFWKSGSWDIAALIFVASVGVPVTKFLVIGTLLAAAHRRTTWARAQRARLYRFVEAIGYWSMLDVIVVALVSALLHFHALGTAEPRLGIVFFGLVVVLMMLAAASFDARLIWSADT
jgi:paraquat-inducible protein A